MWFVTQEQLTVAALGIGDFWNKTTAMAFKVCHTVYTLYI